MAKEKCNWRIRGDSLQLRVNGGKDYNGKRVVYSRTISDYNPDTGRRWSNTQRDKKWHEFESEVNHGDVRKPSTLTIKDIIELHIHDDPSRSPETITGYNYTVKAHFNGDFGNRKASTLTRADVQEWVAYLQTDYRKKNGKKISNKTVLNVYGLLNSAYNTCIRLEILDKNPCENINLPEREKSKAKYLKRDDAIKFMAALLDVPDEEANFKVATLIGITCGLRRGEICGLDESSYDPVNRVLIIEKARYHKAGGGQYEKKPKSEDSKRYLGISEQLRDEIDHLIKVNKAKSMELGSQWRGSQALIKGYMGGNMVPGEIWKWLNNFLIENGIPHIGVHGLRHTYASSLAYLNVDLKSISDQLGHSNVNITDRYLHQFRNVSTDIADKVEQLYTKDVDKMGTNKKISG